MNTSTLKTLPILIEQRDGSKFWYVDDWNELPAPNRKDIQRKYGPGVYRLTDSAKDPVTVKWEIGEEVKPQAGYRNERAPQAAAPPSVAEAVAQAMRAYAPAPSYAPPAPVSGGGAISATLNELRLSLHSLSGRLQTSEHQISTIVYELKQLPDRIADRVRDVVSTMADPEERLLSIADIADRIQSGRVAPEGEGGTDWAGLISGAVQALGARGGAAGPSPEELQQLAQMQAAQQQMAGAPSHAAPAPSQFAPAPAPAPGIVPGLTQEKAQEIASRAAGLGFSYEQAINLALHQGMTADQLLELGGVYYEDEDEDEQDPPLEIEPTKGANGEREQRSGAGSDPSTTSGDPGGPAVG